jgi:hypothetical protein
MPAVGTGKEVGVSDGLRTWVLATLGGWLVALGLVYLGERGLLPPPPVAAIPRLPDDAPPRAVASRPAIGCEAVDEPESAPTSAPEEPAAAGPTRLVVADPVGVNLRAAPAMTSAVIAVLPRGALVDPGPPGARDEVAGPGWQHVVWNGRAGWVAESLLQPTAAVP